MWFKCSFFGKKIDVSSQIGFKLYLKEAICLQKIDNIGWHFIDCGVVKLLNIIERTSIVIRDEVNSYSLTTESPTASNSTRACVCVVRDGEDWKKNERRKENTNKISKFDLLNFDEANRWDEGEDGVWVDWDRMVSKLTCECSSHDLTANRS